MVSRIYWNHNSDSLVRWQDFLLCHRSCGDFTGRNESWQQVLSFARGNHLISMLPRPSLSSSLELFPIHPSSQFCHHICTGVDNRTNELSKDQVTFLLAALLRSLRENWDLEFQLRAFWLRSPLKWSWPPTIIYEQKYARGNVHMSPSTLHLPQERFLFLFPIAFPESPSIPFGERYQGMNLKLFLLQKHHKAFLLCLGLSTFCFLKWQLYKMSARLDACRPPSRGSLAEMQVGKFGNHSKWDEPGEILTLGSWRILEPFSRINTGRFGGSLATTTVTVREVHQNI